ncbi:MAG: hypothetical protein M3N57_00620, partial [Actinomycetota bacterium]|nr:hypothetical protein [Actinomycetota bacterium]
MTKSLGTVLVEQGVIDQEGLQAAMDRQRATGATLPRAIVELGLADERQMVSALARELGMPFADTAPGQVDPQAAALLPRSVATELVALPVAFGVGNELVVAVADPSGTQAMEQISQVTGMAVRPALAIRADLVRAIEHLAGEDATSMPQAQQAGTSA